MGHSFAEVHPELVCEWSEKNAPLKVTDITYGSNKRYWWIGKCGHEWLASPKDRHAGERCPYCAGMRVLEGFNDLATVHPELAKEWFPRNLPWTPDQAPAGANRMVWWQCGRFLTSIPAMTTMARLGFSWRCGKEGLKPVFAGTRGSCASTAGCIRAGIQKD